jgi:SAM-dependent methyltransferase
MEARHWDERYGQKGFLWTAEPNRFLVAEVSGLAPGRALDVACGEGRNAVWLAEQGWTVTGVDFSPVGLDKARRLADARGVNVTFELADVTTYQPLADFDLVVVMYLHLPAAARTRAFVRAAAAVQRGGTLLVVGHDITNLTDGVGGPQDADLLYGPADVAADLAGLEIVKAERVRRPVTGDGEVRSAIDVLVRARRP